MDIEKIIYQAEANAARLERTIVRLWILLIIMLIILIGSNLAWIYYENQFDYVSTTYTQDAEMETESGNAIITNSGDIHYAESQN